MKAGGQHETPKVIRMEDLEMEMGDRDIMRVFEKRQARKQEEREAEMVRGMIDELKEEDKRFWDKLYDTTCDIIMAAGGVCLVVALRTQNSALFTAGAILVFTSAIAMRARA